MSFIDNININNLFKRVSRSSNVKSTVPNRTSYVNLFERKDNTIPYKVGISILRDTQVSTGFDIIKYLLSSKQWILTNPNEDAEAYDFIRDMLQNMETELNTTVKQMTSAIPWGFSVHELMYDVQDGKVIVKNAIPVHIKTLQNNPFVYDDDGNLVISNRFDKDLNSIPID